MKDYLENDSESRANRGEFARCIRTRRLQQRRAATLICVLVVLMIVGLLSAQAVQMMVRIRQADAKRSQLIQARELVELGRIIVGKSDIEQSAAQEFELSLPSGDSASVMILEKTEAQPIESARVVVKYPVRGEQTVTATWQSLKEEVVE